MEMTTLQKVTKGTNSCKFGVVPFSVARHSLIVFVPRLTSRDISSRSDFAFNPAVEGGRRSCGSPPKLRIRKRLRAAVPRILHAVNSSCAVAPHKTLSLTRSFKLGGGCWVLPVKSQMDNPWYLGGVSKSDELPGRPAQIFRRGLSGGDLALGIRCSWIDWGFPLPKYPQMR